MFRKNKRTQSGYGREYREVYRRTGRSDVVLTCTVFLHEAVHHENAVIVAQTEEQGSNNDIYNVKADAQQRHDA
ncbi:hypothetical protein D9M68_880310 [compost metagenome]